MAFLSSSVFHGPAALAVNAQSPSSTDFEEHPSIAYCKRVNRSVPLRPLKVSRDI